MNSCKNSMPLISNTGASWYEGIDRKSVTLDWISITFDKITYDERKGYFEERQETRELLREILSLVHAPKDYREYEVEPCFINSYKYKIAVRDGVDLLFCGPRNKRNKITTCLMISGKGCSEFLKHKEEFKSLLFYFSSEEFNSNFTRIDVAIDDYYCDEITFQYLYEKILAKEYWSPMKKVEFRHSCGTVDANGLTIYLGSSQSNKRICIYDKHAERKAKSDYLIETPYWLRYEMRFSDEAAKEVVQKYLVSEDFMQFVSGCLSELLELKIKGNHDQVRHWKMDLKWEKFLQSLNYKKVKFKSTPVTKPDIQKFKEYFEKSMSKGLLKIFLAQYDGTEESYSWMIEWMKDMFLQQIDKLDGTDKVQITALRKVNELDLNIPISEIIKKEDIDGQFIDKRWKCGVYKLRKIDELKEPEDTGEIK